MGALRNFFLAWTLFAVVSLANTQTTGRQYDTACSCSGVGTQTLDCSNRGRNSVSSRDFCAGRTTKIDLSNNHFTEYPSNLNSHIVAVNISRNQLLTLPRVPPLSLNTMLLDVSHNSIFSVSTELRSLSALKTLDVSSNRLQTLSFLPESCALERLSAQKNSISSLEGPLRSCYALENLDLSYNQLTSLPRGAFSGLRQLQVLKLVSAGLRRLEGGAFDGLQEVKELYMSNNEVTSLPSGIFSPLNKLQELNLDNNNITTVAGGAFTGLGNVNIINLSGNNLTSLPRGVFSGLTKLKHLFLMENQLRSLPEGVFSGLQELEMVGLHTNQLETVPPRLFAGLRSLKGISLSGNRFTTLPGDMFSGVSSMELIELNENQLSSLPPGFFNGINSVTFLDLSSNMFTTLNGRDLTGLQSIWRLDLTRNHFVTVPKYDASWPAVTLAFFDMNRIVNVNESVLRSWLGSDDKQRVLSFGQEQPLRSLASLRSVLNDRDVRATVSSDCKCGGLQRGRAIVQFCVAVSCPRTYASWVEAVRSS